MAEKIKVTPQDLRKRQEDWMAILEEVNAGLLALGSDWAKLPRCFEGNPVKKAQKEFVYRQKEGTEALERLKRHLKKLGEIATIYEEAERGNLHVTPNY